MKKKYLIVGDDNYWYATTDEVTKDELMVIVNQTIDMINKGGQFTPEPSSMPSELYAYAIGGKHDAPITIIVD